MSNFYLIDGYNVMHCIPDLAKLANHSLESARDKLAERIAKWSDSTGVNVQLIFDGRGRHSETQPEDRRGGGFSTVYTSHEVSADALIERAVYKADAKNSVVVVSGDRGITDLCLGMGAIVMSPNHFLTTLHEADQQVSESIEARKRQSEGFGRVEDQLGGDSLSTLEELRKRLEDE